jgi:hypothetical protein
LSKYEIETSIQVGKGFQIRPELWSFIMGRFWHSKRPNYGKAISDIFVSFCISFPTPSISLESKFESNPILTLSGEIPI